MTAVREYREAMAVFAAMRNIDVWYTRLDVAGCLERFRTPMSAKQRKRVQEQRRRSAHEGQPACAHKAVPQCRR